MAEADGLGACILMPMPCGVYKPVRIMMKTKMNSTTDSVIRKVSALTVFFESSSLLCLTRCKSAEPRLMMIRMKAVMTIVLMIMDGLCRRLNAEVYKKRKLYLCQGNCKLIVAHEI